MAQLLVVLVLLCSLVGFLFFWPQDFLKDVFTKVNISTDTWAIKDAQNWIEWLKKKASETIKDTQKTINTKLEQVKRVQESAEKVTWSIDELQKNVGALTDFSWSTSSSWSTWTTNSWSKK